MVLWPVLSSVFWSGRKIKKEEEGRKKEGRRGSKEDKRKEEGYG